MSPWNSYFKDKEVAYLLKESILKYDKAVIFVADIPAISTYLAMWYSLWKAKEKAILKWNNLKNRARKIINELWLDEKKVIIIDWNKEIKDNTKYLEHFHLIETLYKTNAIFHKSVNDTSENVLKNSEKNYNQDDIEKATHYLLSEIAFMEYAPDFFSEEKVAYVYHKNWFVFEDYIAWIFDWKFRNYLDFILLESPNEKFLPIWDQYKTRYEIISERKSIKCMFVPYLEYFNFDWNKYSGVFYNILNEFAKKNNLKIDFVEQTWYWVIPERLNSWFADIFCSPIWPTKKRRLELFFSKSVFESNIYAYINSNSQFAGKDLNSLKDIENLRIAIKENDIHHEIAHDFFPKARLVRVPQLSNISDIIKFVIESKADMTFWEDKLVEDYLKNNNIPEKILIKKSFEKNKPIIVYENCFAIPWWEFELKRIIDENI